MWCYHVGLQIRRGSVEFVQEFIIKILIFAIVGRRVIEAAGVVEAAVAVSETLHAGEVIHEVVLEIIHAGLEVSLAEDRNMRTFSTTGCG